MPPLSVPVPNTFEPFLKVTVSPFGGGPMLDATVAEKVTACPKTEGLRLDVSLTVVRIFTT